MIKWFFLKPGDALYLAVVLACCMCAGLVFYRADQDARNHCVSLGGRVAEVRGGRGGWVCLEGGR